ncbi:thiamine pyrophosphate-dependent enzyme [Providencia burhodogranariea]|uniref:Acetolactate synthase II n=1 Tax=Providencia burhodogranariea DSM 19968 TaxID=1141662 RepID=K8X2A3_9GAMM|nr:thiamine pyrophosphate-dependent enzyme [Providencia burhodogranariea]EKT63802.1 acetolactate synthase II [Providencia burhodogranariea DSM 19968]
MLDNQEGTSVKTGYQFMIDTLSDWGITHYAGVTGGGVIHFLKYLQAYKLLESSCPNFMTLGEYSAGFVPLGHFLANGQISAAVATTGAATKLIGCGLSDAKYHDIPAVFIVAQSDSSVSGLAPLQDTSALGSNMIEQLRCELPDGIFVLDNPNTLADQLNEAHHQLNNSKPVVFVLVHKALNTQISLTSIKTNIVDNYPNDVTAKFITEFCQAVKGKKVVILVGEEMSRSPNAKRITSQLSTSLKAATIWSINGANAVERQNTYGYGYISFGGNDKATEIYQGINHDCVLLVLGACPDEYTVNLRPFNAYHTFYLSQIPDAYGQINHSYRHATCGYYSHYLGSLNTLLCVLISAANESDLGIISGMPAPNNLNNRRLAKHQNGFVDMVSLYQKLDQIWAKESIAFDDVCLAYKDRQYVLQRPNNHISFYSLYRGSSMGGAFGLAVGARLAEPEKPIYFFTGDGCFRLFSGSLGEARDLGLVMFLLNNASLGIVSQGLPNIIPNLPNENNHTNIVPLDYCAIAKASGWDAVKLAPDLDNLEKLLTRPFCIGTTSLLIEIPVDANQVLGENPRINNL